MTSITDSELSDESCVVRYVRPGLVRDDGSVDGGAFRLRSNEDGLSVNWLEYFEEQTRADQLKRIRRLLRITPSRNGLFVELNVGRTKRKIHSYAELSFERRPLEAEGDYLEDPSHCEILGLPKDSPRAALVADMIAEIVTEKHQAVV